MKLIRIVIPLLLLSGCSLFWEYRDIQELDGYVWHKNDAQHFNVELSKGGDYDVFILFRHVHGFPYKDVAIRIEVINEEGQVITNQRVIIPVIAEDKKYLGDGSGDLWDIEHLALAKQPFTKGKFLISLTHEMPREDLQLAMEVGVQINKSKAD